MGKNQATSVNSGGEGRRMARGIMADGAEIHKYADVKGEDRKEDSFDLRMSLIISKLKNFVELFDEEAYVKYGIPLGAMIKETEKELKEMAELMENSIGRISFLYQGDTRYENYEDESVVGLIFRSRWTSKSGNDSPKEVVP